MKRPSNLIIAFILAFASIFIIFALARMVTVFFSPTETELEDSYLIEE